MEKEKNRKKRHRWRKILLVVFAALLLLTGVELLYSSYAITVSRYIVSSEKVTGSFRIIFLSDLHGREFGTGNKRLLEKIKAESPDFICMVGDIFNSDADETEIEAMCAFIHSATEIAPVFYCLGNHENDYIKGHGSGLKDQIVAAGATVLDAEYNDLEINGVPVRLGGYMGYYRTPHMNTSVSAEQQQLMRFTEQFEDTERYKILLNHIPTNWLDWNYRDKYPVDLVLSGHYHGGVIRIPILEQGLYAPYVGKFPPYTKGIFTGKYATCILTTGMAGSYGLPRFFNPPEIVVVDCVQTNDSAQ